MSVHSMVQPMAHLMVLSSVMTTVQLMAQRSVYSRVLKKVQTTVLKTVPKTAEKLAVEKDEKKRTFHLEEAAIAGHPSARYDLGIIDPHVDRAVKHFIIAANLGCNDSIQQLKRGYSVGAVSKEDFAAALRAQHAAVDATKSPQREVAVKLWPKECS